MIAVWPQSPILWKCVLYSKDVNGCFNDLHISHKVKYLVLCVCICSPLMPIPYTFPVSFMLLYKANIWSSFPSLIRQKLLIEFYRGALSPEWRLTFLTPAVNPVLTSIMVSPSQDNLLGRASKQTPPEKHFDLEPIDKCFAPAAYTKISQYTLIPWTKFNHVFFKRLSATYFLLRL